MIRTSDRGIFCWATGIPCGMTVWPPDGSGPIIVGTRWPGAKYGLYVLVGIPVMYGVVTFGIAEKMIVTFY